MPWITWCPKGGLSWSSPRSSIYLYLSPLVNILCARAGPFARPAYVASGHWCTDGNGVWRVSRRHSEIEVDCRQQSQCLQLRSTVLRAFVHCAPI